MAPIPEPDPDNPLNLPGDKLGKYRRCEAIGKGSFATVYKGLHKVRVICTQLW